MNIESTQEKDMDSAESLENTVHDVIETMLKAVTRLVERALVTNHHQDGADEVNNHISVPFV